MDLTPATADRYRQQLNALLPPGSLWDRLRLKDSTFQSLLLAFSDSLARVHNRLANVRREADPRSTLELLDEWEASVGLPDGCLTRAQTVAERRKAVVSRLKSIGRADRAYFIEVAAEFGYVVTIDEVDDHEWTMTCAESTALTEFHAGESVAGDSLGEFGNEQLECLMNRLKPAQTVLNFAYGDP